jgi:hypothetical protein
MRHRRVCPDGQSPLTTDRRRSHSFVERQGKWKCRHPPISCRAHSICSSCVHSPSNPCTAGALRCASSRPRAMSSRWTTARFCPAQARRHRRTGARVTRARLRKKPEVRSSHHAQRGASRRPHHSRSPDAERAQAGVDTLQCRPRRSAHRLRKCREFIHDPSRSPRT